MKRLLLLVPFLLAIAATPARGQSRDVDVVLDQFGVRDAYRPGDLVGIRVALTALSESRMEDPIEMWVQWEVPNADGDIAEYGRAITVSKGQTRPLWLYAPVSPETPAGTGWPAPVRVYDFTDGTRGRELGGVRIPAPPRPGRPDSEYSLIGVVGGSQLGLGQLALGRAAGGVVYTAHEDTIAVYGIQPGDLPDRWEGLKSFEAIAWSENLPQDLSSAQSEALREWIRRGGHFVIVLDEDSNTWGLGEIGNHDLEDLLPTQAPVKREDVPVNDLLPVLSKARGLTNVSFAMNVHVFKDLRGSFDHIDNGYLPLMALPDGDVLVIQRSFGFGRVTIVGINIANRRLATLPLSNGTLCGLPQADVFWNRVLGRRADTPSSGEIDAIVKAERLTSNTPSELDADAGGGVMRQEINMSTDAAAGLMLALVLFLGYWIAAGPGGFYALKHYRRQQHAWLAFAAAAGVFTAFAWGGVHALRKNDIRVKHVTVLDHIARRDAGAASDPQLQRGIAWLSMYIPGYAETSVGIDSMPAQLPLPAQRDLLASWTPPREADQPFPNADRYSVEVARDPDDFTVAARSTSTQMYAHWLGGLDPAWGGLLREDPNDRVRVERDAGGNKTLVGTIINDLPAPLTNPTFIWVWSRPLPARRYEREADAEQPWLSLGLSGAMLNNGRTWRPGTIDSGASYRIGASTGGDDLIRNLYLKYVDPFEGRTLGVTPGASGTLSQQDWRLRMEMLSIYQQLDPPKYLRPAEGNSDDTMQARRLSGRELDLSAWFNRPCLIIIGYLNGTECPIPLRVDGEPVQSEGVTMVRWILPLPLDEDEAFPQVRDAGDATE
jgi:hypothetical protein